VRPAGVLKSGRDMMCVVGDKEGGVVAGQKKARARTPPRRTCAGSARGKDLPRPAEGTPRKAGQQGTPPHYSGSHQRRHRGRALTAFLSTPLPHHTPLGSAQQQSF
jgi:hypothetical protein